MSDAGVIPLKAEDRTILDLECATVAGHTCKVVVLGPPAPAVGQLRELIDSRVGGAPVLTAVLSGDDDQRVLVPDPDFEVGRHVASFTDMAVGEADLPEVVTSLFEQRLPRDRPLWRIDLVPLEGQRAALVWRLHHAIADGTAAMRLGKTILWDRKAEPSAGSQSSRRAAEHASDDERRRGHLAAFIRREFSESRHRSPLAGDIGTRRCVAFARVPLKPLHDAAKALDGASVNDAVLAVVAGGLRDWLIDRHGDLGSVRMRVPVSLHTEGDDAGNRDSYFTVPVSVAEPDPVTRLRAIHRQTGERKHEHDAQHLEEFMAALGSASPRLERLAERIEASARSFALAVSNVPGPRQPVSVLGSPVESMHSLAEIGRNHALRVAVVSASGDLGFGLIGDPAIVDELDVMARGIEAQAAKLISAAA
jgi:WS/DGAT C-terminal domain/Wax ester synthase/diacylglycerol acyltransferase catalytic domain